MSSQISDPMIPFLAFAGSFPELAAKIYISPETMSATVTMVPIKTVEDNTISWTKSPTDVTSPAFLDTVLMPKVS